MFSPLSQVSIPFPGAAPDALRAPILVGNRNVPFPNHLRRRKKLTGISEEAKPNSRCRAQLADLAPATAAAYGVLLFSGGLFAFTKSGSKGSLYGGITGAALMASAYILMQAPENKAAGDALGFGSAFLFS